LRGNQQKGLQLSEDESDLYRHSRQTEVDLMLQINRKLFSLIIAAYEARGIPIVAIAAPTKCEFGKCFPDLTAPSDAARTAFAQSLKGFPITLLDPTPLLTLDDFWAEDMHWRASGHRKIADTLIPTLEQILGGS
jgi:hypothetical protein